MLSEDEDDYEDEDDDDDDDDVDELDGMVRLFTKISLFFFLISLLSLRGIPMRTYRRCDEGLVVEEEGVVVVAHRQRT